MMSVMATPKSETPDEAFGQSVAEVRGWANLSQREFANRLTERGFRVDASAVSRIENGSRSVRLTEALTIADALDVELDFLVSGLDRSPKAELRRARRFANEAVRRLREPMVQLIRGYVWVHEMLRDEPDLVAEILLEDGEAMESPDDYFSWAVGRIARLESVARADGTRDVEDECVPYATATVHEGILSIVSAYADAVLMPEDEFLQATAEEGSPDSAPDRPAE